MNFPLCVIKSSPVDPRSIREIFESNPSISQTRFAGNTEGTQARVNLEVSTRSGVKISKASRKSRLQPRTSPSRYALMPSVSRSIQIDDNFGRWFASEVFPQFCGPRVIAFEFLFHSDLTLCWPTEHFYAA